MKVPPVITRRALLAVGLGAAGWRGTRAQDWPPRAVRLLVPAGPGSVPDVRARWLAERLGTTLGPPPIVENRPGAGGSIAMEAAAREPSDGTTWVIAHAGMMIFNPLLFARLGYEPGDFRLLTRLGVGPLLLLVSPAAGMRSVQDLLQRGRGAGPGLSHASLGIGTPPHLAAELMLQATGMRSQHVPYNSPSQPIADLLGGRIDWMIEGTPVAMPLVREGRLRALAVTATSRLPELPEVPSMPEAGVPEMLAEGWTGLALRRGTPAPVQDRIYTALSRVLSGAEARRWFRELGNDPGGEHPDATETLLRAESERWGRVIDRAGLRATR